MKSGLLQWRKVLGRNGRVAFTTALLLGAHAVPLPVAAQEVTDREMELGRALTERFYEGDVIAVAGALTDQLSASLGGADGLGSFREQVIAQLGAELEVISERVTAAGAHRVYHRSARFEKLDAPIAVVWAFDGSERVAGFSIRPEQAATAPADSRFLEYRTRTPLRLPFQEEWTVVWGGRSVEENYHAAHRDQRFAYDLLIVRDGRSHRGEGLANEDYFCFGRPIVAPGAGVIARAHDGVPDNRPGDIHSDVPPGNHVVIDHGNDEYSFLAHLRMGTVSVAAGDRVEAGTPVGECGNSGRSSEPHLHYHMQNSPEFGRGEGLPTQFIDYLADDRHVPRGEPVRGERIRPVERENG